MINKNLSLGVAVCLIAAQPGGYALAQGVTPPGGGGPIYPHPLDVYLDLFNAICLSHIDDSQARINAATAGKTKFVPTSGAAGRYHYRSILLTVKAGPLGPECAVSGLATDSTRLDDVHPRVTEKLKLNQPIFGVQSQRLIPTDVAIWQKVRGSPASIVVSAQPQKMMTTGGEKLGGGLVHVVLSLQVLPSAAD